MTRALYHFTTSNSVLEQTLAPSDPVVWLTEQPYVTLDDERAAVTAHVWGQYEAPLAELERMRNGGDESGENLTLGPVTQWKYGKRGERHYFEHNGREITATFKPLHACTIRHPNIKADDDTLPFGGKSARTLSQTYRLFL